MEKKWNLQDIKPAKPTKRRAAPIQTPTKRPPARTINPAEDEGTMRIEVENGTQKSKFHLILAFAVFFVVVGAGFLFSFLMGGAEITVSPKHREPTVNATFEAFRTPQVGELSYEILTIEESGEQQVSASGKEEVTKQAEGTITIFKSTSEAERLIKNTRFESPDGLVFRISESVVVPGAIENDAGEMVPGSIQAKVFADDVGEQYNLQTTRFTIPGFKEGGYDALYNAMYAENTNPFTEGYDGVKFKIDDEERETAKQELQMVLRDKLLAQVADKRPAGFVIFDSAITFTYQSLPEVEYGEDLATIKERALLQLPMFKKEDFAAYIAAATIPGYEREPVRIDNIEAITFAYTSPTTTSSDIGNVDSISFNLNGKPQLVYVFDEGKLKADLLGAPKTALKQILGAYPAIEKSEAVVRPFWKREFPTDMEEIVIIENLEDNEQ